MNILFFGDVVGRPGRQVLREKLPDLRAKYAADVVIANGENASGGVGLSRETLHKLYNMGVDVVTSGNHIWKHRDLYDTLNKEKRVIRPANYPKGAPGRGLTIFETGSGKSIAVMNILGRTYLDPVDCPFHAIDALLSEIPEDIAIRFVDFHAETTSEKKAMGWYLHGRASVLVGTHTHVQTADACILPEGTAYLTDAGMCGVEASCLGMEPKVILDRFLTRLPQRFKLAKGTPTVNGLFIEVDEVTGKAIQVELLRE